MLLAQHFEVCHGVTTEPHLQSLLGKIMLHCSANTDDGARLDIAVYGFWGGRFEKAFLDVRVFNPSAQSNRCGPLASVYRRHKQERKGNMSSVYGKLNMPHSHHW